jgi:dihydrofolate synthase/folylpolyglutamate synthase
MMIRSVLQAEGLKVGSYTSPHLLDFRERICINEELIPEKEVVQLTEELSRTLEKVKFGRSLKRFEDSTPGPGLGLTFFEVVTVLAFLYFARQRVDFAVLEVGLGGRLDATNVVNPLVSIITNISIDHQNYLGFTRREIAREKAGIIKENGLIVTACEPDEALEEIEATCLRKNAQLFKIGRHFAASPIQSRLAGQMFSYQGLTKSYEQLEIALLGKHQILNAATALATIELLESRGFPICELNLRRGLKNARNPGRLEILRYSPLIVLDAAHNPGGAEVLSKALKEVFTYNQLVLVVGILKDKDIRGILKMLFPLAPRVIFTQPHNTERAASVEDLTRIAQELAFDNYYSIPEVPRAIELAHQMATAEDLICITGSIYTLAEAKQFYKM